MDFKHSIAKYKQKRNDIYIEVSYCQRPVS